MKICTVIGARPQFIKHAALHHYLKQNSKIEHSLIHTGQHYDANMNQVFFEQLDLPEADIELNIGSHSAAVQIALMLEAVAKHLSKINPDYVIVYGDTNSSLAAAIAASKLHIKVIHIEAGARSFNMNMPEESNRIMIDRLSDILFASSTAAMTNLKNEGMAHRTVLVGDIMKDLLYKAIDHNKVKPIRTDSYIYATIHRPSNTDNADRLLTIITALNQLGIKVICSLHPRTKHKMKLINIDPHHFENIDWITPVSYYENLRYITGAKALITDSGGMQKEAYWLKTTCITLRKDTEWVETVHDGWNTLVYDQLDDLEDLISQETKNHNPDLYGDGSAARAIIDCILRLESGTSGS